MTSPRLQSSTTNCINRPHGNWSIIVFPIEFEVFWKAVRLLKSLLWRRRSSTVGDDQALQLLGALGTRCSGGRHCDQNPLRSTKGPRWMCVCQNVYIKSRCWTLVTPQQNFKLNTKTQKRRIFCFFEMDKPTNQGAPEFDCFCLFCFLYCFVCCWWDIYTEAENW